MEKHVRSMHSANLLFMWLRSRLEREEQRPWGEGTIEGTHILLGTRGVWAYRSDEPACYGFSVSSYSKLTEGAQDASAGSSPNFGGWLHIYAAPDHSSDVVIGSSDDRWGPYLSLLQEDMSRANLDPQGEERTTGQIPQTGPRPFWLPKTPETLEEWREAYDLIRERTAEQAVLYDENMYDNPELTLQDYVDHLKDKMRIRRSTKWVGRVIEAGGKGWLSE
jgi:hypothetical protein